VTSYHATTGYPTSAKPDRFTSVAAVVRWIRSKTGITGDVVNSADNVTTALVIDNSGSMSSNDPQLLRRDAGRAYVTTAVDGDQVGIVGFEDSAYTIAQITGLPAGRNTLLNALNSGVRAGGGTNIGAGLSHACTMLNNSAVPPRRAAILLTDGDGGYSNEASCFASRNWRIYTVGLGSNVNTTLLRNIATQTGGTYQPVPTAANLPCEFQKLRASIAGAEPKPCLSDLIRLGQTIQKLVLLPDRLAQIVFSTTWPGSDVEMSLESPSGRVITRATDAWDVEHSVTGTSESYVVKVPEPGEWKVKLYGTDIEPAGEPVVFGTSEVPFENAMPTARPTPDVTGGRSPLSVAFTANASDSDGTVAQVTWDFGDGDAGAGASAQHLYRAPGRYMPSVTVVDDVGETRTVALDPIVVTGSLPSASFTSTTVRNQVSFDASASADADGAIVGYLWDFDGDKAFDRESTGPRTSFTYPAAGTYDVTLVVESVDGETADVTRPVTAEEPRVEVSQPSSTGGTVPATLSLTMGAPASFGTFTPGVAKEYTATTSATVISTAGDAALTLSDPGHLTNGAFSLAEPVQVSLGKSAWTGPTSNDVVDVTFKQLVKASDPLRTGTYSKTLTFTLSTTNPCACACVCAWVVCQLQPEWCCSCGRSASSWGVSAKGCAGLAATP
jgi:PKD repeat protein